MVFETLRRVFEAHGTTIEALDQAEAQTPQREVVEDLITIISLFAGKTYGLGSCRQREVVERVKKLLAQT